MKKNEKRLKMENEKKGDEKVEDKEVQIDDEREGVDLERHRKSQVAPQSTCSPKKRSNPHTNFMAKELK